MVQIILMVTSTGLLILTILLVAGSGRLKQYREIDDGADSSYIAGHFFAIIDGAILGVSYVFANMMGVEFWLMLLCFIIGLGFSGVSVFVIMDSYITLARCKEDEAKRLDQEAERRAKLDKKPFL